jgi:hypothetical protein
MELVSRDDLNRIAKLAFDRGEVESVEAALELFRSYRFGVVIGKEIAQDRQLQAALLTIANAGPRACLGGVDVSGATDIRLDLPWAQGMTAAEAVAALSCRVGQVSTEHPVLVLGNPETMPSAEIVLHVRASGWRGGVSTDAAFVLPDEAPFAPAGSLAGAVAVAECFQHLRGDLRAGRRTTGLSLWRPDLDWTMAEAAGRALAYLPSSFWLLGLGHLGQASAWTIGLLPYPDPSAVTVMLQDRDTIVAANKATSMLLDAQALGEQKTRLVSRRLEALGFETRMTERSFDEHQRLQPREPLVALAGFDNAAARRHLSGAGFSHVVDAGLGGGPDNYLDVMLHAFPSSRLSSEIGLWKTGLRSAEALVENTPGYQRMIDDSGDRCGVLDLAGASIATAFVGCTAAALSVAEVCRSVVEGPQYEVVDFSLCNLGRLTAVENALATPYAGAYVDA